MRCKAVLTAALLTGLIAISADQPVVYAENSGHAKRIKKEQLEKRLRAKRRLLRDRDRDGLPDRIEKILGTSGRNSDSDDDGVFDSEDDANGNGVADGVEFDLGLFDLDNDGLADADEIKLGFDPYSPDSDHDGIKDGDELKSPSAREEEDDDDDDDEHHPSPSATPSVAPSVVPTVAPTPLPTVAASPIPETPVAAPTPKKKPLVCKKNYKAKKICKKVCKNGKCKKVCKKKCVKVKPKATPKPSASASPKPSSSATPAPSATPRPSSSPNPTSSATPRPTATATPPGNFDGNGNTTKFGIPSGLVGNISRGSSFWSGNCRSCHSSEKSNKSYSTLKNSLSIPQMNGLSVSNQNLADLTAYLNRSQMP